MVLMGKILTVEFAPYVGIGLCWRKPTLPFLTTDPRIPIKNILAWRAFVFCACEKTQLSCVLFHIVTAVYKFDSRLIVKETDDMWWPLERRSCDDRDLGFDRICILPRMSSPLLWETTQVVKVNCIFLSSKLYLCFWNSPPMVIGDIVMRVQHATKWCKVLKIFERHLQCRYHL